MQTSILIPTFNRQKYLKRCVETIQKHTTGDYEILFVRNGMTRGAADWLQDIVRDTANCHLIETRDTGYAASLNQTINGARSDYIVFMHNDVIVTDQWLTGMLNLMVNHDDIGCVGPMSDNVNGIQAVGHPEDISEDQLESFAAEFRMRNQHRRVEAVRLSDVCVGMRRVNIEQIGGFDDQFNSQDVIIEDICLSMRLEGFRNAIAGDVLIYHADDHKLLNECDSNGHSGAEDRKVFTQKWNYLDLDSPAGRNLLVLKAIEKGIDRHHAGHTRQAVEILSEGVRYAVDNPHLAMGLARALADVGHHQEALDLLSSLCDCGPEELQSLELMGYCQHGLEDFGSAEVSAERLLAALPDSAAALNLKGLLEYRRGNKQSAANLYQKAIASDPGYGQAHTHLGILNQESGQISEAIELFEKGVILSAVHRDAAASYHSAIASQDAYDRAQMVLREAVALHPHHKQLIYYLIDVFLKSEKYQSAMEYIKLAVARFGVEDGILDAALAVHPKVGPKTIEPGSVKHTTVSLCMITKNEEAHLARCLCSADAIVDEIVVIDTGSTDRTRDIATVFGARVDEFEWNNDFSAARNVSLAKASGDWILVLDADEVISTADYENFRKLLSHFAPYGVAYEFCTRNYTDKVNLIGWKPNDGLYVNEEAGCGWTASDKVRLFPNHPEIRFQYPVHELVEPSLKQKGMTVERCDIPIHHYGKLNQHATTVKMMPYYRLGKKKNGGSGG